MFCGSSELPYSSYLHYIQLLDSIEFVEHNNSISLSKNIPSCHQIDDDETEDEKQFSDSADLCFEVGDFSNPLEVLSDIEFLNCYHLSKKTVIDVMDLIKHGLVKYSNRGSPVPPLIALLITLQYFAEGCCYYY